MNHWLKIVSIVELDPQAMLTIRLPIYSQKTLFIMMSGERLGPWASCLFLYYICVVYFIYDMCSIYITHI